MTTYRPAHITMHEWPDTGSRSVDSSLSLIVSIDTDGEINRNFCSELLKTAGLSVSIQPTPERGGIMVSNVSPVQVQTVLDQLVQVIPQMGTIMAQVAQSNDQLRGQVEQQIQAVNQTLSSP